MKYTVYYLAAWNTHLLRTAAKTVSHKRNWPTFLGLRRAWSATLKTVGARLLPRTPRRGRQSSGSPNQSYALKFSGKRHDLSALPDGCSRPDAITQIVCHLCCASDRLEGVPPDEFADVLEHGFSFRYPCSAFSGTPTCKYVNGI